MHQFSNSGTDTLIMLTVATALMLLLVTFIVLYVALYQKKLIKKQAEHRLGLLEATIQAQEKERGRIAQDIHDDVGVMLSAVKQNINNIGIDVKKGLPLPVEFEKEVNILIDEVIDNTRRIARNLLPPTLEKFGLAKALNELCNRINTSSKLTACFRHEGNGQRHDSKVETALYRMAQELVNNSIKHSGADKINVALLVEPKRLEMTVSDNGKGFDLEEVNQRSPEKRGLGLKNIESRMSILNGKIMYGAANGSGTEVTVNVEV